MMSIPDCSGVRPLVWLISAISTRSDHEATYSLVEERKLISSAQHAHHQHEHGAHRSELSPVLKEGEGHEGALVELPLPRKEGTAEDESEDEKEDDPPAAPSVIVSACRSV